MTESKTTTRHNAEATRRVEGAVLDVQGVQAIIDVFAWAEDRLPVDLSGESRRVAFMLLSERLGEAVNDLQFALEKGALEPKKAEPAPAPVQAGTITIDRMESNGIWSDMLNIRDTAKGASKILATGLADADNYQIITGMVELMAEKLDALCDRNDRATSGTGKAA